MDVKLSSILTGLAKRLRADRPPHELVVTANFVALALDELAGKLGAITIPEPPPQPSEDAWFTCPHGIPFYGRCEQCRRERPHPPRLPPPLPTRGTGRAHEHPQ